MKINIPEEVAEFIVNTLNITNADNPFETGVVCSLSFFARNGFHIGTTRLDVIERSTKNQPKAIPTEWKNETVVGPEKNWYRVAFYMLCNDQCFRIAFGQFDNYFVVKVEHVKSYLPYESFGQSLTKFIPISNFTNFRRHDRALSCALHFTKIMTRVYSNWIDAASKSLTPPLVPDDDEYNC